MYARVLNVAPSDASCTGEIKVRSLLNYLQNVAGLAVQDREGAPGELMERGYAWVLLQYEFEVQKRLPRMDESFRVRTQHTTSDGFHTLRAFEVETLAKDEGGEDGVIPLLRAKTSWILIDLAAGRPVRAKQHLPEIFDETEAVEISGDFRKIPKTKGLTLARETVFPVRFHDLDANTHVNNAVYFEWAYEATPLDLLGARACGMCADFRVGAKFGDAVRVEVYELPRPEDRQEGPLPREFVYEMWSTAEESDARKPLARMYAAWTES